MKSRKYSKFTSLLIVFGVYILAVAAGFYTMCLFPDQNILIKSALGDVSATVVVFGFSVGFRNSSMYDPYWSVIPLFLFIYWLYSLQGSNISPEIVFLFALVFIWGSRLTLNWIKGWRGLHAEDWRYRMLKEKSGAMYWFVNFWGIHMIPTIIVFLSCLPLYAYLRNPFDFGFTEIPAVLVIIISIFIEATADIQLHRFKNLSHQKAMETGLWKYSRHPNYFGELGFWFGLFLLIVSRNFSQNLWTGMGILSMILLFLFISIPMMEKRLIKNKPGYQDYKKRVSKLMPWFRK